jgi:uncharacterized protein
VKPRTVLAALAVLLISAVASAQPQKPSTEAMPRLIVVHGHGEAAGRPDRAVVTVGVETQAATAGAALAENNKKTAALVAAVKQAGVGDGDVQTTSFSVFPFYGEGRAGKEPVIMGYRVVNELTVRAKDVAGVGALLDKLVSTGANQVRGVSFSIADPTKLGDEARKRAMQDAERKARQLAELAGAQLGAVHSVREDVGGGGPVLPMRMMAEAKQSSVPLEAGESVVAADVEAAWMIR